MAKRCNIKTGCSYPRANWWKQTLGTDWLSGGSEALPDPSMVAYNHSISNKFVDLYFDRGVYNTNAGAGAIEASDLLLSFVAGGASAMSIASIKKPDHHLSASASALAGGESVIRVFFTITGTVDGTETYSISPVSNSIFDVDGVAISTTGTGNITLNITPFVDWNTGEKIGATTTTGLGISAITDLMAAVNLAQATDADRPLHFLESSVQFDLANTESLGGGSNANFAKQQGDDFAIIIKDLKTNMFGQPALGWVIAYYPSATNGGWVIRALTTGELQFVMIDAVGPPPVVNVASFPNFEDQEGSFIFQNEGGVLSIYDEFNNLVGTQGSTAIGVIPYTSVNLFLGKRENGSLFFNGELTEVAFVNQALTSAQREVIFANLKETPVSQQATLTKYMFPMINGSTNPSAGETMQVFLGDGVLKDGVIHLFYNGNNASDIDKGFKATRADDGSDTPFTKVLDTGVPKIILAPSGGAGTYDKDEVFIRTVFYDESVGEWKMYFTASQGGASPQYTIGLATSADGEAFTKTGQVYTDGTDDIIIFAACKAGVGDYRAIASVRVTGTIAPYHRDYLTSADGITWVKVGNIDTLFQTNIIYISNIIKSGDDFYIIANAENRDSAPGNTDKLVIYKTTDFASTVYIGTLLEKSEPGERAITLPAIIQKASTIEVFYTYFKNQNKSAANGGEGYTAIRRAVLNKVTLQQATTVDRYPTWVKKYYPLNRESCIANTFYERIDGQTTTFAGVKQWSIDGLNFFDFLGTGFSWPAIDLAGYTDDFALKMRVEIVLTGTIDLFKIGTDIVVQLVSGNLRVALNNGTKDYITTADIAKPTGITDPGNHVYVGFIWQGGVLKLCVGNTIDIADTQTVDNAMTDILNGGANVQICDGATIEAGRVVIMSGQTDQQWIDTDL